MYFQSVDCYYLLLIDFYAIRQQGVMGTWWNEEELCD